MAQIITLQPAPVVDRITEDGTELTQLPYPFHVREDGRIERQDFWRGNPARVVGFVADFARQAVDVWWRDAVKDPQSILGMYLVTQDDKGGMASWPPAITKADVTYLDEAEVDRFLATLNGQNRLSAAGVSAAGVTETWYLATCLECTPVLPQPFRDAAQRDSWAEMHAEGTGHTVLNTEDQR